MKHSKDSVPITIFLTVACCHKLVHGQICFQILVNFRNLFNLSKKKHNNPRTLTPVLAQETYWENSCSFGLRYVSWYKYLIVSLVFSHLGFWSGNLFLIAPFPDLCLLVPLYTVFYVCFARIDDNLYTIFHRQILHDSVSCRFRCCCSESYNWNRPIHKRPQLSWLTITWAISW